MTSRELEERKVAAMERANDEAAIANREVLSLELAALYCCVSEKTIRQACHAAPPEIEYARHGKFYRFPKRSLDRWLVGCGTDEPMSRLGKRKGGTP
jgi:hypothetical protein